MSSFSILSSIFAGSVLHQTPSLNLRSATAIRSIPIDEIICVLFVSNKSTKDKIGEITMYKNGTNKAEFNSEPLDLHVIPKWHEIKWSDLNSFSQPTPTPTHAHSNKIKGSNIVAKFDFKFGVDFDTSIEIKELDDDPELLLLIITRKHDTIKFIQKFQINSPLLHNNLDNLEITADRDKLRNLILTRDVFMLTPNCIDTIYIADNAITNRRLSSDIQLLLSAVNIDPSITTDLYTMNQSVITLHSDADSNNASVIAIQEAINSEIYIIQSLTTTETNHYNLLTNLTESLDTNQAVLNTMIGNNSSDTAAITILNTSINSDHSQQLNNLFAVTGTLISLQSTVSDLTRNVSSDEYQIGVLNSELNMLQTAVQLDNSNISDLSNTLTTLETTTTSAINAANTLTSRVSSVFTYLTQNNSQISDISGILDTNLSTVNSIASCVSDLSNITFTTMSPLIASNITNIRKNTSDISTIASSITSLESNLSTNLSNLDIIISSNYDSLQTITTNYSDNHSSISTLQTTVSDTDTILTSLTILNHVITDSTTSDTTYITVPYDASDGSVYIFYYTLSGGGGSGGGTLIYGGNPLAGGGGGSGDIITNSSLVSGKSIITYTLGAGGNAVNAASDGIDGIESTLVIDGYTITAPGGKGGGLGAMLSGGNGGDGYYGGGGGMGDAGTSSGGDGYSVTANGGSGNGQHNGTGGGNSGLSYNAPLNYVLGGIGGGPMGGRLTNSIGALDLTNSNGQFGCGGAGGSIVTSTEYSSGSGGRGFIMYYFTNIL